MLCTAKCDTIECMRATSFRLPEQTIGQLNALATKAGMTITQVVIVAIDRMFREVMGGSHVER